MNMLRTKERWWTGGMVVLVGMLLSGSRSTEERSGRGIDDGPDGPRLVHLAPGSSVAGALPEGWTDRVIRSVPRLALGALETLPGSARRSATLFRTVILADVAKGPRGYNLRRIGLGNAVPFGDREVVVTSEGPKEVRAALSTIERIVANTADAELCRGRIVASTPTFALFRGPSHLVVDGQHRDIEMNYALLVDPTSGDLLTLIWAGSPRRVIALARDPTFDCALDVAVTAKVGPLPVAWSFAMAALPPGRTIDVPTPAVRTIESGDPATIERTLHQFISGGRR
jgi:hypothetical protein